MQINMSPELMIAIDDLCAANGIQRVGPESRKSRLVALLLRHALNEKPAVLAKLCKALAVHKEAPHRTTAAEMLALMGPLEYGPMKK